MVVAECIVITLLIVVVWNMVAAAATRHPGVAVAQAIGTPAGPTTSPLPDLTETKRATPGPLPGLNLNAGFWRLRLGRLNQDQVFLEQLEWRIVHAATDTIKRYLETVVLPATSRTTIPVFSGNTAATTGCDPASTCGVGRSFAGVSVQVLATAPIVAERPFYVNGFSFGSGAIRGGHDAFGANGAARQWTFAEGTTLPSGSPITLSWAIAPRWVWNSPPAVSTTV